MQNKKIILGISFVLVLGVGFFLGMEYKAYQLRSALSDLGDSLNELGKGFNNGDESTKADDKKSQAENDLNKKITLEITKKGFDDTKYQNRNTFTFQLINKTDKNIEGVQGTVVLRDLFGNFIKEVGVGYDKGIKAGESKLYPAGIEYNQYMDEDIKLQQTDLKKLKYEWNVDMIIYEDGTKDSY